MSTCVIRFFFFKQKTAYEMRISDWSSDVCSSDLRAQHIRDHDERRKAIEEAVALTRRTVDFLAKHGLACDTVGGAGTGTYPFEIAGGVHNELQAGSYIFMDADYGRNLKADGGFFDEFENSLFVHATVMSKPTRDRALLDAGLKAFAVDAGMPVVHDMPGVAYVGASAGRSG